MQELNVTELGCIDGGFLPSVSPNLIIMNDAIASIKEKFDDFMAFL